MKKHLVLIPLAAAATLSASGYRIPETSSDAVALSAACVANANGADASYYNPANMVLNPDANLVDASATYIRLTAVNYRGTYATMGPYDTDSEPENFIVPGIHYTSPKLDGGLRWGFSVVVPAGLSKRWESAPGVYSAEEFTLEVIEFNPTVAYPVTDRFSVGAGLRALYASGVVKSSSPQGSRDMEGDAVDYGYNLALSFRATEAMTLAATYRSKVNIKMEGDARITIPAIPYSDRVKAEVSVPVPASLNLAVAHKVGSTTVEFNYERTYWSEYEWLDFNYPDTAFLEATPFGAPIHKAWKDSNTYRLGFTHVYNETWTSMAAIAYDETPVPDASLGFELPDSDAWVVSMGGTYRFSDALRVGVSALASLKDDRRVDQGNTGLQGEFTDSAAYLISIGAEYRF